MTDHPLAVSTVPPAAPADTDYDAIWEAVTATMRGRWFLEEYVRRNRNADTERLLASMSRIEEALVREQSQQANQSMRIELLEMARTIAQTRAAVAEAGPAEAVARPPEKCIAPDVASAAERLRDIARNMRACG